MRFVHIIYVHFLIVLLSACSSQQPLPTEIYRQFQHTKTYRYHNDTLTVIIDNSLMSPIRVNAFTNDSRLNNFVRMMDTITLAPQRDTSLHFYMPGIQNPVLGLYTNLGDVHQPINPVALAYPFPKGKAYTIIQGYTGRYSHTNDYSQYAIDFNLNIGDTVCSADDGYVVGVIKEYKYGGHTNEWRNNDKSNFITIYHPHSGLFTQYVHLKHNGAFVKTGDKVNRGQAIGLSGMTGFTDVAHLHFNVLQPKAGASFISVACVFEDGKKGESLTKGINVKH